MKFPRLVQSFSMLAHRGAPLDPWDANAFLVWLCSTPLSHGELLAGRFLLGVWNQDTDWVAAAREQRLPAPEAAARFDLFAAASVWDAEWCRVLTEWLSSPGERFP